MTRTLGAPLGAFAARKASQSGCESRMSSLMVPRNGWGMTSLLESSQPLDVVQLPRPVIERRQGSVEAEDREPAPAGHRPDPVLLLSSGHLRSEVDVDRA